MVLMAMFLRLGKMNPGKTWFRLHVSIWDSGQEPFFYHLPILFSRGYIHTFQRNRRFYDQPDFSIHTYSDHYPDVCHYSGLGMYNGLEAIGRTSELLLPIVIIFILVLSFAFCPR